MMKVMKKVLAVFLAVFLAAAPVCAQEQEQEQMQILAAEKSIGGMLASALPQTQTTNLAGEWKLTKGLAQGLTLSPADVGITDYSLVLNADGTCTSHMESISGTLDDLGTWSQNGVMVTLTSQINGETATLSLQPDGTLRALEDQTALFFTQVSTAPQTSNLPGSTVPSTGETVPGGSQLPSGGETVPGGSQLPSGGETVPGGSQLPSGGGVTPAAGGFEGQWVLTKASANGQTIDQADLGLQMTVTLNAGGTGTIWDGEETVSCTWTQNGTSANVTEDGGVTTVFVMQADGTVNVDVDGVVLTLAREGSTAAPVSIPAAEGQMATGNGFTMQVPKEWMEINDATVQQLVQTYGQQAVDTSGLTQQLQYIKSMGILLYYSADLNSSVNVAQESAQGVTMDTLPSLGATYAAGFANAGVTNYHMAGPVDFSGKTYYTGTYDAAYPTTQYYQIVNGVFYTITLTNVSDTDAAMILSSFTVNG